MNFNAPVQILICVAIGYFLGGISPSYIIGKFKGYDVRENGSKNAGASNMLIISGKLAFVVVAVLDVFKAWFSFWICVRLFPELKLAGIIGGVACVIGHMFPLLLHFRGGKGFACLAGLCLGYSPRVLLIMFFIALGIAFITNYVCIVTSSMSVIFPIYYGITTSFWIGALVLAIPAIPIFLKHMENFRRIKAGQELHMSYLWKKDKELQRAGYER